MPPKFGARQEPAGRAGLAPVVALLVGGARLPPACHRRPPSPGPDWWSFLEMGFEQTDYLKWRSLREMEDARFLGLTMPRVLMR